MAGVTPQIDRPTPWGVGVDVLTAGAALPAASADRIGRPWEVRALGIDATFGAKEAATKAVGGGPPGSSLLDLVVRAGNSSAAPLAHALDDLGADGALSWQFETSAWVAEAVGHVGLPSRGHGVVAEIVGGHLLALCLAGEVHPDGARS